jgi:hypothetical protein
MANPVKGYDGLATIGVTPITVNKIRTWTFTSERDEEELGPWVGDANKVTVIGGKLGTLELEGDIPIGGDPGIQDIVDAYEAGTNDVFVINTEDGYQITMTAPAYNNLEIGAEASGTQTWSVSLKGAYTIAQDT